MASDAAMLGTWEECLKRLKDAPDAALEWSRSGVRFLRSSIGNLPFLASTAVSAGDRPDRDETHYFLVPHADGDGFTLVEKRRLPQGIGAVNSLPKVRVFHLHDQAALAILEDQLAGKIQAGKKPEEGVEEPLAERLEAMGEVIDRQSGWVTGGIVVIGGLVCLANPLLGAGIAAKALIPDLGGKLAKFGLGTAADSIRKVGASWRDRGLRKESIQEVRRMKPELVIDPVLSFLDRVAATKDRLDPAFAEMEALPEWWRDRDRRLTMEAAAEVWSTSRWSDWAAGVRSRVQAAEGA